MLYKNALTVEERSYPPLEFFKHEWGKECFKSAKRILHLLKFYEHTISETIESWKTKVGGSRPSCSQSRRLAQP